VDRAAAVAVDKNQIILLDQQHNLLNQESQEVQEWEIQVELVAPKRVALAVAESEDQEIPAEVVWPVDQDHQLIMVVQQLLPQVQLMAVAAVAVQMHVKAALMHQAAVVVAARETRAQLKIHRMTECKDLEQAEDQLMPTKELVMAAMVLPLSENKRFIFKEVGQECLD